MSFWIFQSRPDKYDLRRPDLIVPGRADTWYATRYREDMAPEDVVFFWLSGDENIRGIYGQGQLTSKPYLKPEWDSYGINVIYEKRFRQPLSVNKIKQIEDLRNLQILKIPIGTNFVITQKEADAILRAAESGC